MEEYQDPSTLRSRFQGMVAAMLEQRIQKAMDEAEKFNSPSYRIQLISESVGKETAQRVFFLVRQIEHLQRGKPVQDESNETDNKPPVPTTSTTPRPAFHLSGQQTLPKPVRELFLESSIVNAFYFTPLHLLKDLPWKRLIASTRRSIREYQEWIAQDKQNSP